jgi:hypothetical protein
LPRPSWKLVRRNKIRFMFECVIIVMCLKTYV